MSVDQSDVVDYIATKPGSNVVQLIIFDPFDWGDVRGHLTMLQAKIDLYLAFIKNDELRTCGHEPMPDDPIVKIVVRHVLPVPSSAAAFVAEQKVQVGLTGVVLEFAPATTPKTS